MSTDGFRRSRWIVLGFIVLLLVTIYFAMFTHPFRGPELVRDGSFEDDPFVPGPGESSSQGYIRLCGGSTTLPKWQVAQQGVASQDCTNADDAVVWATTPNGPTGDPNKNIAAKDGARFVDLTGLKAKPPTQFGKVQQDLQGITGGAIYELSFWIGSSKTYPPPTPAPPKSPEIGILVEVVNVLNVPGGTITMPFVAPAAQDVSHWEQRTLLFTAGFIVLGRSTTIAFSGFGNPGTNPRLVANTSALITCRCGGCALWWNSCGIANERLLA